MAHSKTASGHGVAAQAEPFAQLIAALREPARYPDRPERVDLLETHISCVLLAGDYAYKVKKPVDLGFLNFTSLAARRLCCAEELRLNCRTAPSLYLDVIPITGSAADPVLGGSGPPIEYAVKMRRFPQDALLDRMARDARLEPDCLDALATRLAAFHQGLEAAGAGQAVVQPYSSPAQVLAAALQNFDQIRKITPAGAHDASLDMLRDWTERTHAALAEVFAMRKRDGFVRECHGDLHLGNIVLLEGVPTPFDGIEFNPAFRWIDVMSEVAFLVMDLAEHRLPRLAFRFLNRYLEATGDYAGLRVLRFYLVYRAMVRAKVACIRAHQAAGDAVVAAQANAEVARYLAYARGVAQGTRGAMILMHGLSGSGKSTLAADLAEQLQAVQLRSDVERKRLYGLDARARSMSGLAAGIYTQAGTERTYAHLAALAQHAIRAGYAVIVDAAFLAARQREAFRDLARAAGVACAIVSCTAPDAVLRERVTRREAQGLDASEAGRAVLERQIATRQALAAGEADIVIEVDTRDASAASRDAAEALARGLGLPAPRAD